MLSLKSNIFSFTQKNVKFTVGTLLKNLPQSLDTEGVKGQKELCQHSSAFPPFFSILISCFQTWMAHHIYSCVWEGSERSLSDLTFLLLLSWYEVSAPPLTCCWEVTFHFFWIFIFVVDYFQQLWRVLFLCGCFLTKEIYHQNRNGLPWIRYSKTDGRISS